MASSRLSPTHFYKVETQHQQVKKALNTFNNALFGNPVTTMQNNFVKGIEPLWDVLNDYGMLNWQTTMDWVQGLLLLMCNRTFHILDIFNSTCYVKELVDSRSEISKSRKEEGRSGYGIGCCYMSFPFSRHFYTIHSLQWNLL